MIGTSEGVCAVSGIDVLHNLLVFPEKPLGDDCGEISNDYHVIAAHNTQMGAGGEDHSTLDDFASHMVQEVITYCFLLLRRERLIVIDQCFMKRTAPKDLNFGRANQNIPSVNPNILTTSPEISAHKHVMTQGRRV